MKFEIEKAAFAGVLSLAARLVEKRNTIPILANVMIVATHGQIKVKSTNLDVELTLTAKAEVLKDGGITVQAYLLNDIVRKFADKSTITFELLKDGTEARVSSGRSSFSLQCLPTSDFPDMNIGNFTHDFSIPSSDLVKMLGTTQFAISTEETRHYLNGIYMHAHEGNLLRFVATDGHRLARTSVPLPPNLDGMPGIIIPRKTVDTIMKIAEAGKPIHFSLSDSKIRLEIGSGDVVMTSKLIDGTFPDYQRVIPTQKLVTVRCNKKELARVVDTVSTISSERGRAVKITMDEGMLVAVVSNPDSGTAEDQMPVTIDGSSIAIGFNAAYMNAILENISSEEVLMEMTDAGGPAKILPYVDGEQGDTAFVLMPMRI